MASRQRLMTVFSKVADAGHPHCVHAERLISRAAAELVARPSPGRFVSSATPIRLSSVSDGAVSVAIDTPAEVNAAGLLQHLIDYDNTRVWRLVSEQPALPSVAGQHVYSVKLSAGSLDASLEIPHNAACPTSEHTSAPGAAFDQATKTRLLPGELRFTRTITVILTLTLTRTFPEPEPEPETRTRSRRAALHCSAALNVTVAPHRLMRTAGTAWRAAGRAAAVTRHSACGAAPSAASSPARLPAATTANPVGPLHRHHRHHRCRHRHRRRRRRRRRQYRHRR